MKETDTTLYKQTLEAFNKVLKSGNGWPQKHNL